MREAPRSIRGSSSFWLVYLVIYSYVVFYFYLYLFVYHRWQAIVLFLQSNLIINHQGVHVRI